MPPVTLIPTAIGLTVKAAQATWKGLVWVVDRAPDAVASARAAIEAGAERLERR